MLKVTIELQETDDERVNREATLMLNASNLVADLFEFKQSLRSKIKHGSYTEEQLDVLEKVQQEFTEIYYKYSPED